MLRRPWLVSGYLLLYLVLFASAALLDQGAFVASLWYPPAGLTVFGILAFGWPGLVLDGLGSLSTLLLASAWKGEPLSLASLASGALLHPLAYGLVLMPLRRWMREMDFVLQPERTVGLLLISALLAAGIATAAGLVRMLALGLVAADRLQGIVLTWMVGDFVGIITFAPLFLLVRRTQRANDPVDRSFWIAEQYPGLGASMILVVAPILLLGLPLYLDRTPFSPFVALLLLVPLAWVTLQHGLASAIIGVAMSGTSLVMSAVLFDTGGDALSYQLIMVTIVLTGLLLGVLVEGRNRLEEQLRAQARQLDQRLTEQRQEMRRLYVTSAESEQHLSALLEAAPVGIAELDPEGNCTYLNPAGLELAQVHLEDVLQRPFIELLNCEDSEDLERRFGTGGPTEQGNRFEFRFKGSERWMVANWIEVAHSSDTFIGSILIFVDITDRHERERLLWYQANFDVLTGLPNRQFFMARLGQDLARARRNQEKVALLWIDLDGFKSVNDSLGHAAGDELLQKAAHRMQRRMRDYDTVARMGGDEFAVILSDLEAREMATQVAKDLVELLNQPYLVGGTTSVVSASIGISFYPDHTDDVDHLLRYADQAMYQAKESGKNRVATWEPAG